MMKKNMPEARICIGWTFRLCLIFGYFGVSDTDTDVLLPLGMNVNFPPGSAASSPSVNNGKSSVDINTSSNKLRMKRANGIPHDEEMRLWDQIFANALATSNTSQWVHLRQIFDRVEEELHKTKSSGNASLNQLNKIHTSFVVPHQSTTIVGGPLPKILGPKHPKFSYHRVSAVRGRGRPFTAVTLAVADSKDIISEIRKMGRHIPNADHISRESKTDHEQFSTETDYQLDHHHQEESVQHESLLNDDFNHFKKFDHSEPSSADLLNKFESFQNFQNFDGLSSGTSRNVQMGVSGQYHGTGDDETRMTHIIEPTEHHSHHHRENKGRHHHRVRSRHFHLKTLESDSDVRTDNPYHHRSEQRRKHGKHHHTHGDHKYQAEN